MKDLHGIGLSPGDFDTTEQAEQITTIQDASFQYDGAAEDSSDQV